MTDEYFVKNENSNDFHHFATLLEVFSTADAVDLGCMFLGSLGAIATGLTLPIFNILFGKMNDQLNEDSSGYLEKVNQICLIIACASVANIITAVIQVYFWVKAGERQSHRFRVAYVTAILEKDIEWFDVHGGHHLATEVSDVCGKITDGLTRKTGEIIQFSSQIISSMIVAFFFNWKLTLVLLVAFPAVGGAGAYMIHTISAAQNQMIGQYANAGAIATQSLTAIRTVTAFNLQSFFISKYRKHLYEAMEIGLWKGLKVGLGNGLMFGVYFLVYALGFWYGAVLVANDLNNNHCDGKCVTGGEVLTVFFCVTMASEALGQITPPLTAFSVARVAIGKVLSMTTSDRKGNKVSSKELSAATSASSSTSLIPSHALSGSISIRDLTFAYPSRPSQLVCQGLNLEITAGETIAFVGPSGSGKSTLISLLLRFYEPLLGEITIDGLNLLTLDKDWLRAQIGYVGQEPVLFNGTIAENIGFGDLEATVRQQKQQQQQQCTDGQKNIDDVCMERIVNAAKRANAHDFILSFPDGYATQVGPSGVSLSGGQKQRIAIARALVKEPSILLLDEATSALDAASEKIVQESIDALSSSLPSLMLPSSTLTTLSSKPTIVIIAHRLSTVRNADKICVMEGGKIVEMGKHEELVVSQGRYYDLMKLQAMDDYVDNDSIMSLEACSKEDIIENNIDMERKQSSKKVVDVEVAEEVAEKIAAKEIVNVVDDAKELASVTHRINALLWQYPSYLYIGCIGAAIFGGVFPCWGMVTSKSQSLFYDTDSETMKEKAAFYAYLYIVLAGIAFISAIAQYYGIVGVGERISASLRSQLYEALLRQPISYFDFPDHTPGQLATLLAEDVRTIHKAFGESLAKQLMAISALVVGLVIAMMASWKLSLVVIATFPLNIIASIVYLQAWTGQHYESEEEKETKEQQRSAPSSTSDSRSAGNATDKKESNVTVINERSLSELEEDAYVAIATTPPSATASSNKVHPGGLLATAFHNIRTIHALAMQSYVIETYDKAMKNTSEIRIRRGWIAGCGLGTSNFVVYASYALLFWYGAQLMHEQEITFEELLISMLALMFGVFGLGHALSDLGDQTLAIQAAKRVFALIDSSSSLSTNPNPSSLNGLAINGYVPPPLLTTTASTSRIQHEQIVFQDISFRYPTRPTVSVCDSLSFTITAGEVVAFVGPSGCGKSTIMNLLLRFYDPHEGRITWDGKDIADYNLIWLRNQIGYVGQEPVLFPGTIAENVAFGLVENIHTAVSTPMTLEEAFAVIQASKQKTSKEKTKKEFISSHHHRHLQHTSLRQEEDDEGRVAGGAGGDDIEMCRVVPATATVDVGAVADVQEEEEEEGDDVDPRIIRACQAANAHDFILSFPDGYATQVGPSGVSLSGGQKQRIAIARALVKEPSILLLDEATSALDAASEKIVQESIDALSSSLPSLTLPSSTLTTLSSKPTIVIIAHRLSTVRNADKICVMEGGKIVEMGKHEELLNRVGLYKRLWEKQSNGNAVPV